MDVGVLALQGDFAAHGRAVALLGHGLREVRTPADLAAVDGLILPGGESSTMLKLMVGEGLVEPLRDFCRSGRPVLGTCAGAILLAHQVSDPAQDSLDVLDIDVQRNGYGRQLDSRIVALAGEGDWEDLEAVFIRAPIIRRVGPGVEVLVRRDDDPVLVRQGPVWAATFHPEMTSDTRVLRRVLESAA